MPTVERRRPPLSRFVYRAGLVTLRQTFVRRSHDGWGGHKTMAGSGCYPVSGCPRVGANEQETARL